MKDKLHEQLSALVDDELAGHEQALLLKQLAADTALQAQLSRYQLASDALHNHLPQRIDPAFHTRIQAALGDAPPQSSGSSGIRALLKPATGVAVAPRSRSWRSCRCSRFVTGTRMVRHCWQVRRKLEKGPTCVRTSRHRHPHRLRRDWTSISSITTSTR